MNNNAALQIKNLECVKGTRSLFANLTIELNAGEMLLVQGANGSGKSSLLRLIAGFSTPAKGEIFRENKNIDLHYIGHANGIKPELTVTENLQLSCHLLSAHFAPENIPAELQLHSLQKILAKNLSAGQKRKLALAKLFLIPRKLWILDEPLTALDTSTQEFFLERLKKHLQDKGMAIISSHHTIQMDDVVVKQLSLSSC